MILIHTILNLIPILWVIIAIIVTALVTGITEYCRWKNNIKNFLPEIAKAEIQTRDRKIAELEKNNETLTEELEHDRIIIKAIRSGLEL